MIKPRGIILIVGAIILFVLAGITRVGWILLFDTVLWGTIVVSAIMPWLAIGKLQVRRRVVGWDSEDGDLGPMEGDAVEFEIRLHNRGILPCMLVTVHYNWGIEAAEAGRERLFMAWLGRGRSLATSTKVRFGRRGLHSLPPVKVETSLPFGLFRRTKRVRETTEVLVLPKVYPIHRLAMLGETGDDAPRPLQARVGEQIVGSRGYVFGDPWQHIHWRNTARTAQAQVKEFEKTPDSSLVIVCDIGRMRQGSDDALEHAIRIAASVGDYVCRSGGTVKLRIGHISEETSDRHRLLKGLALLKGDESKGLPALLADVPPFSDVLAIVRDTDTEGIQTIAQLARSHHRVTAMILRGFEPDSTAYDMSEDSSLASIAVYECWPDRIPEALARLGQTSSMPEKSPLVSGQAAGAEYSRRP
ncbi:MAG: DUF58 domain-containing protein [Chloroflexi bacterium]|nr:DUF58 domain-containing protein [Chloroflexota bacterium]